MKKALLLSLLLATPNLFAATAYVTDEFKVMVRTGESAQHRIISSLKSGAAVNVLSRNNKTGYTQIRLPSGRKGYVLSRQLLDKPVARDRLAAMQAEMKALKAAPGELQQKLADLTRQHQELQRAHSELQQTKKDVEQELAGLKRTSANAVRISNERNQLRRQVAELTRSNEELKQENRELNNQGNQRWFLIGGGVTLGGILIGLVLPHLRMRRRKDSWGSL